MSSLLEPFSAADAAVVEAQLQRRPRDVVATAWRCHAGRPGVIVTRPRLGDGTPFPTLYYLTCPRAIAGCSALEAAGLMTEMTARLLSDPALAAAYRAAHAAYLADRAEFGRVPEIAGVSAGGMPDRVKCLHVLAAHALAKGPGVNPLGDEVVDRLGAYLARPCLPESTGSESAGSEAAE